MASRSPFGPVKDYPKKRAKRALQGESALGGENLKLPRFTMSDYAAGSPLKLEGSEKPFVLNPPKLKKLKPLKKP